MYVVKRDGHKEPIMFDKITARVRKLCYSLNELVVPVKVSMRVIEGLYDGVTTSELDNLAAEIAATMTTTHPDYAKLAARISVSNLHKNTKKSFSETMSDLYTYVNPRNGKKSPFERDKLSKSMLMALRKRDTDDDAVERAQNAIVRQLEATGDNEIQSKLIGELVMNALAQIDNVAYIRYASVYRNFREASDFGKYFVLGDGETSLPELVEDLMASVQTALNIYRARSLAICFLEL